MATERKESRNRRKSSLCWQMWRIAIHLSSMKLFRMGSKYTYQKSQPESTCFKEEAVTKKFLFQVSISRQNQFQSRQCEQRMWKFCFLALSSISSDTLSIARSIPILSSRRLYSKEFILLILTRSHEIGLTGTPRIWHSLLLSISSN